MANTRSVQIVEAGSQYLSVADTSLAATFPAKDGGSNNTLFTFELWVKYNTVPTGNYETYLFCDKWPGSGGSLRCQVQSITSGNQKMFTVVVGTKEKAWDITWVADTWYHYAVTYNAGTTHFYVNGTEITAVNHDETLPATISTNTADLKIGGGANGGLFDGLINDYRVWATERSAAQIAANYGKQLVGNESGLVAYYKFADNLLDETANNSDLTFNGTGTYGYTPDCPFGTLRTDYYNTGDDEGATIWSGTAGDFQKQIAQTFTASKSYLITCVRLKMYRAGTANDNLTVSLHATSAGLPTGSALASGTIDGDTFGTDAGGYWYNIDFSAPYALVGGTVYAIVCKSYGADGSGNDIFWKSDGSSPTYAGGQQAYSTNSGSTWTAQAGNDAMFELFTTDRFLIVYPSSDAEISAPTSTDWATSHDATSGSIRSTSGNAYVQCDKSDTGNTKFNLKRYFAVFDTSAIGSGMAIRGGLLKVQSSSDAKDGSGTALNVFDSTCSDTVATTDFDLCGTTPQATAVAVADYGATGVWNTFYLNSAGISNVEMEGKTKFALREVTYDVGNSEPAAALKYFGLCDSSTSGTASDPYLEITYYDNPAPPAPANIKSYNGLATASMKSINGLAIASVKSKNGLT